MIPVRMIEIWPIVDAPVAQNSPRLYSDVSVMHAVSRVPSSRPHPMPSRIASGMKSISHADTRVSHGV